LCGVCPEVAQRDKERTAAAVRFPPVQLSGGNIMRRLGIVLVICSAGTPLAALEYSQRDA
jgi:hypothetical protein